MYSINSQECSAEVSGVQYFDESRKVHKARTEAGEGGETGVETHTSKSADQPVSDAGDPVAS